jgi:hypothetical protein
VNSPIYLDPSLATCYHGDYDMQVQASDAARVVWSDDRTVQDGHNDPDIWFQKAMLPGNAQCHNFVKDGNETAVDCGGSACAGCGLFQACAINTDCVEGLRCVGGICNF